MKKQHKKQVKKRYRGQYSFYKKLVNLARKYEALEEKFVYTIPAEIYLSSSDRITHLATLDKKRNIVRIINVSYEIKIEEEWITIVRFDSAHGYLHRHTRISLKNSSDVVDRNGIKIKGNPKTWYTWAIEDIRRRFIGYRTGFSKRSKIPNLGY